MFLAAELFKLTGGAAELPLGPGVAYFWFSGKGGGAFSSKIQHNRRTVRAISNQILGSVLRVSEPCLGHLLKNPF